MGSYQKIVGRGGLPEPIHELNGDDRPVPLEHPGHQPRRDGVVALHFFGKYLVKLTCADLRSLRNRFDGRVGHVRDVRGAAEHSRDAARPVLGEVVDEFGVGFVKIRIPHFSQTRKFRLVNEFVE